MYQGHRGIEMTENKIHLTDESIRAQALRCAIEWIGFQLKTGATGKVDLPEFVGMFEKYIRTGGWEE